LQNKQLEERLQVRYSSGNVWWPLGKRQTAVRRGPCRRSGC
jgi:hypothetical protein